MNSKIQPDLHPDAESLNAFVERALGERERGPILAHLAECGRCRQVVYLAQEAGAEIEASAVAPPFRQKSGLRNWWLVWAPVAALAAIVTLAYVVHLRRSETGSELAKVADQAATQKQELAAKPPAPPTGMQAAPLPAAAVPVWSGKKKLKAPLVSAASTQLTPSTEMISADEASELPNAGHDESVVSPGAPGEGFPAENGEAKYKLGPALAARAEQRERAAAVSQMHTLAARAMAQSKPSEAAKREPTVGMSPGAAPAAPNVADPALSGGLDAGRLRGMGRAFAVYKANSTELPNGSLAVSMASAQHSMLAVDRLGSVYVSEDFGSHWESVAQQWSGRAVAVRVQPVVDANSGAARTAAPAFEIVNDQGQVWVSTGGRIWKAK